MNKCLFLCIMILSAVQLALIAGCAGYSVKTVVQADQAYYERINAVTIRCTCSETAQHTFLVSKDEKGIPREIEIKNDSIKVWFPKFNKNVDEFDFQFSRILGKPLLSVKDCSGTSLVEKDIDVDLDRLNGLTCSDVRKLIPEIGNNQFKFVRSYSRLSGQLAHRASDKTLDTLKIRLDKNQTLDRPDGTSCNCTSRRDPHP